MSFASAKQRAEAQPEGQAASVDASLLCTEKGCKNRWSTTFYGRLCTDHEAALTGRRGVPRPVLASPVPVPKTPAQPHWQDDRESA